MKDKEGVKKFVDDFSSVVNCFMSKDEIKEVADAITNDHRTLQQNKMRLIVELLKNWSDDYENGRYDLRNEATCKLAHTIVKDTDYVLLAIPMV